MIDVPLPPSAHSKDKPTKQEWAEAVKQALQGLQRPPGSSFEVVLDFYGPWRDDGGKRDVRMPDIDRMASALLDLIAQVAGYNDRENDRVVMSKRQSSRPRCTVWLRPCGIYSEGT